MNKQFKFSLVLLCIQFVLFGSAALTADESNLRDTNLFIPGWREPLIPQHPYSEQEAVRIVKLVNDYLKSDDLYDDTEILNYLQNTKNSPWRLSLLYNLGKTHYRNGAFSKAISRWEDAWDVVQNVEFNNTSNRKSFDTRLKVTSDHAFAELVRMYARLGYKDEVSSLLAQVSDREFIGSSAQVVQGSREGLYMMLHEPGLAYRCGPSALRNAVLVSKTNAANLSMIDRALSSERGFSLFELNDLAEKSASGFVMAKRVGQAKIPVPSVVHWNLNHYAAIVGESHEYYHIEDPTFGEDLWVPKQTFDRESSGYFLIREQDIDGSQWQMVDSLVAKNIHGMGFTTQFDQSRTTPDDEKNKGDCECPIGMPNYNVHSNLVSLNIRDIPVGYDAIVGPDVKTMLTYNSREYGQPAVFTYSNFGPNWVSNWSAYLIDNPNNLQANVEHFLPGGGSITHEAYDAGTSSYATDSLRSSRLVRVSDGSSGGGVVYEYRKRDGSVEIYSADNGATSGERLIFLTQMIDRYGNALTFSYDVQMRLQTITDASNKVTTFFYENSDPLKVTRIEDPFGREAIISYDNLGRLDGITDAEQLTTTFDYDAGTSFIELMTTPYGPTTFSQIETQDSNQILRVLEVTTPDNETERTEFYHRSPQWEEITIDGIPFYDTLTPEGMSVYDPNDPSALTVNGFYTAYMGNRNTFYWDKYRYKNYYSNPSTRYPNAKIVHWLHKNPNGVTDGIIESTKEPLENRVWYTYPGQGRFGSVLNTYSATAFSGTFDKPSSVGRVLDDGTSQVRKYEYNALGRVSKFIDPVGNEIVYEYYSNDIDLWKIKRKNALTGDYDVLAEYQNYVNHQAEIYIDAQGNQTTYEYLADGRLDKITNELDQETDYVYLNNKLYQIIDANNNPIVTYTYDAADRVRTEENAKGYIRTFSYDDLDRLTRIDHPDTTYQEFTYDKLDIVNERNRLGEILVRDFDDVRQLQELAIGTVYQKNFDYFANGDLKSATDGEGNVETIARDVQSRIKSIELGTVADPTPGTHKTIYEYETTTSRLKKIIDPLLGETEYSYDLADRVNEVIDANYNKTIYGFNTYGELESLTSPDTGLTQYQYYLNGQLKKKTDARNIEVEYTYDELNRLETVTFPASPSENITYRYDEPVRENGLGRLTSISDESGDIQFDYDELGNVKKKTIILEGITYVYEFGFDAQGRFESITYPSGREVIYGLDSEGNITSVSTKENATSALVSLLNSTDYLPFGPIKSYSLSNGLDIQKEYYKNYRLKDDELFNTGTSAYGIDKYYEYEFTNNIKSISDTIDPSLSELFTHDRNNRLDTAQGDYGYLDYDYDPVGNRKRLTENSTLVTDYGYELYEASDQEVIDGDKTVGDPKSNRLVSMNSDGFTHSASGNLEEQDNRTLTPFIYNNADRLIAVDTVNGAANYIYNALGQRVMKLAASPAIQDVHYHYNNSAQMLGEYASDGSPIKEYIYANGLLLAVIVADQGLVDSDGDGMDDNWEITHFGGLFFNGLGDPDGDFLTNLEEYTLGLNPLLSDAPDSDGDGMPDAWELHYFGDIDQDGTTDFDGDGFKDVDEYLSDSDPTEASVGWIILIL